ncbi:MAG: hypothetical protein JJU15_14255 [Pararhodobacter sp.]|nr:hypothetical protein [Pararhodobacter sp.]
MRTVIFLIAALLVLGGLASWVSGPEGVSARIGLNQGASVQETHAADEAAQNRDEIVAAEPEARVANALSTQASVDELAPETTTDPATEADAQTSSPVASVPPVAPVGAQPLDRRIILSGHSLTDAMREELPRLVRAAGGPVGSVALSTIPGSPMDWRWEHRTNPPDARADIADFDVMVQTERVALSGTRPWHNSDDEALRWARHGWENGAGGQGAEVLLYASWVTLDTGPGHDTHADPDRDLPWRDRLDREFAGWEAIMAHVNANRPDGAPQMRMIPATLVMAAVYDAIDGGQAPEGLSDIRQLFSDDIHAAPLGAWLVALTHYAVIYARDPRGLPGPEGGVASPALVDWAQVLVWDVVTGYPGTGVQAD